MKRTIFNQKGGVGKTSITCNLAAAFAVLGRKTLVVDLDAQGNATSYLLASKAAGISATIADFFASTLETIRLFEPSLASCVYPSDIPGLAVIPASQELAELQPKLESRYKIFKFGAALDKLIKDGNWDEVLIDTPPALNIFSMSALMTSDRVLIPYDCDAFSAEGLERVIATVEEVKADHRPNIQIEGIVINQFQAQAKLPMQAVQNLQNEGHKILKPWISTSVAMRESHARHIPLPVLKPTHKVSQEFLDLARSLLGEKQGRPTKKTKKQTMSAPRPAHHNLRSNAHTLSFVTKSNKLGAKGVN
jgi:chromosome partitioning protein